MAQNMPRRSGYTAVSVLVDTTPRQLSGLIEQVLGLNTGSLATIFREVTIQVDPEVSSGATVRFGNSNVGTTVSQTTPAGSVVQKGMTLVGQQSDTTRAPMNAVYMNLIYAAALSGTAVLNIQLWDV